MRTCAIFACLLASGCGGSAVAPSGHDALAVYGVAPDGGAVQPSATTSASSQAVAPQLAPTTSVPSCTELRFMGNTRPSDVGCGCTRREPTGPNLFCPGGIDVSTETRLDPSGGTASLGDTPSTRGVDFQLLIPENALDQTVGIRITETSVAPPHALLDASPLYHVEPEALSFRFPAAVQIPFSQNDGPQPWVGIYWSSDDDPCTLSLLADNYQNAGFNQGTVRHGGWAIVGHLRDASTEQCP